MIAKEVGTLGYYSAIGALDYGDLNKIALWYLDVYGTQELNDKFRYIIIDEFQDTNNALSQEDSIRIGEYLKKKWVTFQEAIYHHIEGLRLSRSGLETICNVKKRIDSLCGKKNIDDMIKIANRSRMIMNRGLRGRRMRRLVRIVGTGCIVEIKTYFGVYS
jgi:hypothetical protein